MSRGILGALHRMDPSSPHPVRWAPISALLRVGSLRWGHHKSPKVRSPCQSQAPTNYRTRFRTHFLGLTLDMTECLCGCSFCPEKPPGSGAYSSTVFTPSFQPRVTGGGGLLSRAVVSPSERSPCKLNHRPRRSCGRRAWPRVCLSPCPPGHIFPLVHRCYPACQTRHVICNYYGLQCIPRAPWVCLMF